MKLIGNYLSPYTRRVAISLNELGLPFDLDHVMVFDEPERVKPHNPVTRVPTLVLDDGSVLFESYAILDAIDQMVGADKALIPLSGPDRRKVMQLTALANACAEKAQWAFYEPRFRPPEMVNQDWVEHNERQVIDGFAHCEGLVGDDWVAGTDRLTQADITLAVAFTFADKVRPNLSLPSKYPGVAAFTGQMEQRKSFKAAPLP